MLFSVLLFVSVFDVRRDPCRGASQLLWLSQAEVLDWRALARTVHGREVFTVTALSCKEFLQLHMTDSLRDQNAAAAAVTLLGITQANMYITSYNRRKGK